MIRVVIARHEDSVYKEYLDSSINMLNVITHEVRDNDAFSLSLTQKYNIGIADVLADESFNDDDIIVFSHEDIKIKDHSFTEKLNMVFRDNDVGLCGVIGCNQFTDNGMWWANTPDKLNGHIIQENGDKTNHLIKGNLGYYDNIVAVDGLMFAIKGKLLKDGLRFDEEFNFHHYDIDICFQVLKAKHKVVIADILIQHKSTGLGSLTDDYKASKTQLIEKWSKGYEFPISVESFNIN